MKRRYTKRGHYVSEAVQDQVFEVIKDHVRKPCPTNIEIASLIASNRNIVCNAITCLCDRGIIKRLGKHKRRAFEIVETGGRTDPSRNTISEQSPHEYYPTQRKPGPEDLPGWIVFEDFKKEELDEASRAYLSIDAAPIWPRSWPEKPRARKNW